MKFSVNPVLVKELRGRMRGARAYLILTGTLGLLGLVSYGLYRIARLAAQSYGGQTSAIIGQGVFTGLAFFALGVICFITPALTAGAISSEHERKTFDLLMATPLSPASVLFGKLVASLSYVGLLIIAAVPLVSLSYVFGGVATIDMLQVLLLLFGYTLTFGVIGLFFSTLLRRSGLATVLCYIVIAAFIFGTVFVYAVVGVIRQQQPPNWILALNPFSAMASALVNAASPNMSSAGGLLTLLLGVLGGSYDVSMVPAPMPLWRYTVGIYAWLTVALYIASMILVRPVRRFRLGVRGWTSVVIFVVVSILAVPVAYGPLSPERIIAWVRWNSTPQRDLVVNGTFASSLEPAWIVDTEVERADESGGEVRLVAGDERPVVNLSRTGVYHAETSLTQDIGQAEPQNGWLRVRVTFRIKSHDVPVCGIMGSECPLMIKLYYTAGGQRHYWMQGFYAVGNPAMSSTPPLCTTCEINQPHIRVPLDEWYTYESPDLVQDLVLRGYAWPSLIDTLTVAAGGHSYEVEIAEVALLVKENRPPIELQSWFRATSTPVFMQAINVMPIQVPYPHPPMPMPAPTATPVNP